MKTSVTQSISFTGLGLAIAILATGCVVREVQPATTITTLPHGYKTELIGGTTYYVYGTTYYRPGSGGYVVVESPN